MERLSRLSCEELSSLLLENDMPVEVVESFKANAMDGDSLATLFGTIPGPDSLKELVAKVGLRMKVYKMIKALYNEESLSCDDVAVPSPINSQKKVYEVDKQCSSSPNSSSFKESTSSEGSAKKVKKELRQKKFMPLTPKCKVSKSLPNPFPIPNFRASTEANLTNEILTESDRKYIVQTLAVMLMSYVQKPSLGDCEIVSEALHMKYTFLQGSEGDFKWFIYNRAQNVNRPAKDKDSSAPVKKVKIDSGLKHNYANIPPSADDDEANERNIELLLEEFSKVKPSQDIIKTLLTRTFAYRRSQMLNDPDFSVSRYIGHYRMLKKAIYATLEFQMITQIADIKNQFDQEFLLYTKAIIVYCKRTQKSCSAIQLIVNDLDEEVCDTDFQLGSIRCLALLLSLTKAKKPDGDIPFFIKFVKSGTPPSEAVVKGNSQPQLVVIEGEYGDQYFISVEEQLVLESRDFPTAIFLLVASYYIFNLAYHAKVEDLLCFVQEKIALIPSASRRKCKSPVVQNHINGINRMYKTIQEPSQSDSNNDSD